MNNLRLRCVELAREISYKNNVGDVIEDAKKIYEWVKDCPDDEQSSLVSKFLGGLPTVLTRDSKSDSA